MSESCTSLSFAARSLLSQVCLLQIKKDIYYIIAASEQHGRPRLIPDGVIHTDSEHGVDLRGFLFDPTRPRPPVCSDGVHWGVKNSTPPLTRPFPNHMEVLDYIPDGVSHRDLEWGDDVIYFFIHLSSEMMYVGLAWEIPGGLVVALIYLLGISKCKEHCQTTIEILQSDILSNETEF
jgi:hypothetical protein